MNINTTIGAVLQSNKPATSRQTWAIFCASKFDVRNCNLTFSEASEILNGLNVADKKDDYLLLLASKPGAICKGSSSAPKNDWQKIYDEAYTAGIKAGNECLPVPMVVQQHANMADDNSPVVKSYFVPGGVCGFAWVVVSPGNCSFANWLKKNKLADKHYYGGVSIWIGEFNQSMTRKEACAHAMAEVFQKYGIKAYSGSRMD